MPVYSSGERGSLTTTAAVLPRSIGEVLFFFRGAHRLAPPAARRSDHPLRQREQREIDGRVFLGFYVGAVFVIFTLVCSRLLCSDGFGDPGSRRALENRSTLTVIVSS